MPLFVHPVPPCSPPPEWVCRSHFTLFIENSTRHSYKQPPVLSWHSGVPSSLRYSSISTLKHLAPDFLKCFLKKDPRLPNTFLWATHNFLPTSPSPSSAQSQALLQKLWLQTLTDGLSAVQSQSLSRSPTGPTQLQGPHWSYSIVLTLAHTMPRHRGKAKWAQKSQPDQEMPLPLQQLQLSAPQPKRQENSHTLWQLLIGPNLYYTMS